MDKVFDTKMIAFVDVESNNSVLEHDFRSTVANHKGKETVWAHEVESENFHVFRYLGYPDPGKYSIVVYNGDGKVTQVMHGHRDTEVLQGLKNFLNSF